MAAAAQESSKDLSPRGKTVVWVNAYEKELVRNLAQHALRSQIPSVAGPAIVVIGNSRIIRTSLSVESSEFTELFKRLPIVLDDADPIITKIEERVEAALNDSGTLMIRERKLPLVIVCSPFKTGNECLAPMVDVWAGPEELELTWGEAKNFEVFIYITNTLCAVNSLFHFLFFNSVSEIRQMSKYLAIWVIRAKVRGSFRVEWRYGNKQKADIGTLLTSLVGSN